MGSMIIDGIAASMAIDSSGEILDVEGCDISDLTSGVGVINWEHRGDDAPGASANDIVGKVIFAKKIFKKDDCDNDRERMYWDRVKLPYIYIKARLFDGSGHPGAIALAAIVRDHVANNEPILVRYSIEGSTLSRDGNTLKESIARRVACTIKPCNRTAVSGLLEDPNGDTPKEKLHSVEDDPIKEMVNKKAEHPLFARLGGDVSFEGNPLLVEEPVEKTLSAGSYDAAPSTLSGGSALQVEDRSLRARTMKAQAQAALRDWDHMGTFKSFLKSRMPEADDSFIDKFADMVDDYTLKLKKGEEDVEETLAKKEDEQTEDGSDGDEDGGGKGHQARYDASKPITFQGQPLKPNKKLRAPMFDEDTGVLHTPVGSLSLYNPDKDTVNPKAGEMFRDIWHGDDVRKMHDYATTNWLKVHHALKEGRLPESILQASTAFSQLSPNCLDEETEALTQRGWVKGFDLKMGDVLLTKNAATNGLEWQKPTDLRFFPDYEGKLVEFKSRSFHAVTTPKHEWLVTTGRGNLRVKTSEDITFSNDKIHRTGDYTPSVDSGLSGDEAELLGWFVTDGHYYHSPACDGSRSDTSLYEIPGTYTFLSQSTLGNPEKCARIDALLSRLGMGTEVGPRAGRTDADGKKVWCLGPRLTKMLLSRTPNRFLTVESLLDLNKEALLRLREAMGLGDGHRWQGEESWAEKECLVTGRKEQADAFQALLSLTGSASSVVWRDMSKYEPKSEKMKNVPKMTGCYVVTALQRKYVRIEKNHRKDYTGKVGVWCPILPNHFFVARRSGHVFITKNTPVPVHEMMFAYLVDSMKDMGMDLRSPQFGGKQMRANWLGRDTPQGFPEHANDYFQNDIKDLITTKTKITESTQDRRTDRPQGSRSSFMLANDKFDNMAQYHKIHEHLVDLVKRHGTDTQGAVAEMMDHKRRATNWNNGRRTAQALAGTDKEKADPGEFPDWHIPGLKQKTGRFAYAMLGGGNAFVPDTHFTRHLFGLNKESDANTISYLKSHVVWHPNMSHILNGMDRWYFKNHPAVQYMLNHPQFGEHFKEDPTQAVFPAFWGHWLSIAPHEGSLGHQDAGVAYNQKASHRPLFDYYNDIFNDPTEAGKVVAPYAHPLTEEQRQKGVIDFQPRSPYLPEHDPNKSRAERKKLKEAREKREAKKKGPDTSFDFGANVEKSEQDYVHEDYATPPENEQMHPHEAALLTHEFKQKWGAPAASMMFFTHILPKLWPGINEEPLPPMKQEWNPEKLARSLQSAVIDLRKAAYGLMNPSEDLVKGEPQQIEEPQEVTYAGKRSRPGLIEGISPKVRGQKFHVIHEDPNHLYVTPHELGGAFGHDDVRKVAKKNTGKTFRLVKPLMPLSGSNNTIDSSLHGVSPFMSTPEQHNLVHGMDLDQEENEDRLNSGAGKWMKGPQGLVYVKGGTDDFRVPYAEAATHELARDFFGLGSYVPTTSLVKHPGTGRYHAVIRAIEGGEHAYSDFEDDPRFARILGAAHDSGDLDKMMLMDLLTGNNDRHEGNILYTRNGMKLIDHGFNFTDVRGGRYTPDYLEKHAETKTGNGQDWRFMRVHKAAIDWIKNTDPAVLKEQFEKYGVSAAHRNWSANVLTKLKKRIESNPVLTRAALWSEN